MKPKSWDFTTTVYLTDQEGTDWEFEVGISYDAIYEPAYISGPPENCYPDSSEMILTDMVILDDLPEGITEKMVMEAAERDQDLIEEEALEDFHDKRRNHGE